MASFIWSLAKLDELLDHSEPTVQEWAVAKLFQLYPQEARSRLPLLLRDQRSTIVSKGLDFAGQQFSEELLPVLRDLYFTGSETVSARAMQVLGGWRAKQAVPWMRERILRETPLGKEQIVAMIHALGRIPEQDAYTLLKQTEAAVTAKDSSYWSLFYAALLEHHRAEELATLLEVVLDADRKEDRRRDALGLLLARVDAGMNPSDVFFANHSAVRKHLAKRLAAVREGGAAAGSKPLEVLGRAVDEAAGDASGIAAVLKELPVDPAGAGEYGQYAAAVLSRSLAVLAEKPGDTDWHYGVACLALSAAIVMVEAKVRPKPSRDSDWQAKLDYLLRDGPSQPADEELEPEVIGAADRQQLVARLTACLEGRPHGWGAVRALEMLGAVKAAEASGSIVKMLAEMRDEPAIQAAQKALLKIGAAATEPLLARLEGTSAAGRFNVVETLAQLPTRDGVRAVVARFPSLYAENPQKGLQIAHEMGAGEFLPFLEKEYRPGEWHIGKVYVHICRVNGIETPRLAEIERDVQKGEAFLDESKRAWSGEVKQWPAAILLELACRQCGRRYQYEVHEVHQHAKNQEEEQAAEQDFTPYKHGLVIMDDIRCKNCRTLNQFELTAASFAQVTTESLKVLAFQRMNIQPPAYYPFKHVRLGEKDGRAVTLADTEREHLDAVRLHPSRPSAHLALGKFYEYVKEYPQARRAYLRAVDLDSRALEAMAGLARLDHAEGKTRDALNWIQGCYDNLERGNFYLTEDRAVFKKMVRQKRRDFSRELGSKLEDKPVEIRYRVVDSDYPKNKPCPCGSGKKYKLCCMK